MHRCKIAPFILSAALALPTFTMMRGTLHAASAPDPSILALAGGNLPSGANIAVERIDRSPSVVNSEDMINKPDSHGGIYAQLGGHSSLIEHVLLPPFDNNVLREVWLLATIFPNAAAAAQAYTYDSDMGNGCTAFPVSVKLSSVAATCDYQDTGTSPQTGVIVATTAGRVEFVVAAFVNSASPTAQARASHDATFIALHEAARANAIFAPAPRASATPRPQPTATLRPQPTQPAHLHGGAPTPVPNNSNHVVLRTVSPGKGPLIEGVDPLAGRLVVAAGDNHADISLVSTRTGAVASRVSVDQAVDAATVDSEDHIAYVVGNEYINDVGDMNWINTRTGHIIRTMNVGNYPDAIAYDRQSHRIFVANSSDDDVMTFSSATGTLVHTNNVGKEPSALAVDEQDNRVYALSSSDNTITTLDATTGRFISTISINENAQDLQVLGPQHRLVAIFCPSSSCTDNTTDSGSIMVRDGRTGHLIYSGSLGQAPQSVSYDPTLNKIVVFDVGANAALFLDPSSGRTVRRIALGDAVAGIAVLPHVNRIVALGLGQVNGDRKPLSDGDLRVYNLQTGHLTGHLDVAESTDGIMGDDVSGHVFLTNSMENSLQALDPLAVP